VTGSGRGGAPAAGGRSSRRCDRGDVETIVCGPYHAVPNFAKSLIVVARRGFSDAARRSIVSRVRNPARSRNAGGRVVFRSRTDVFRDGNAMSAYKRVVSCASVALYKIPLVEDL